MVIGSTFLTYCGFQFRYVQILGWACSWVLVQLVPLELGLRPAVCIKPGLGLSPDSSLIRTESDRLHP